MHSTETNGKLNLIDGDREGTVLTEFFKRISNDLKTKTEKLNSNDNIFLNIPTEPTIGFVQTYYANYSSSAYLSATFGM
jgi:phosphoacetylglucosamine mutase